jgi:flagellar assembly protein FliH
MQAVEKFMFEYSFDNDSAATEEQEVVTEQPVEEEEEEVIVPTFSEEDLELSRQQGFEAGKQEGLTATTESLTRQINETLVQVDQKLGTAFQTQGIVNDDLARSALSVAKGICKKMLPGLAAKHSFDEVDRVITDVFAKIVEHPGVTITVHSSLTEEIEKRINELSADKGYQGKIIIQTDETMQPSDCKVEWFNGGSERDAQAMWREITTIVERNIGDNASYWNEPDESANAATVEETEPEAAIETEPEAAIETEPEAAAEAEPLKPQETPEEDSTNEVQKPNIDD